MKALEIGIHTRKAGHPPSGTGRVGSGRAGLAPGRGPSAKSGDRHDEAQPPQRLGLPQPGGLPLEPAGLVAKKALLDVQAIVLEAFSLSLFGLLMVCAGRLVLSGG